jgi:hypothetical protein
MTDRDLFDASDLTPAERRAVASSELRGGLGWLVFGAAVLVASLRMDRLESQGINPYTVPGLLPALLGIALMLLGALLALRSWRRGGRLAGGAELRPSPAVVRRLAVVIALVVAYSFLGVGHGVPFWLASAAYVALSILLLQRPQRIAAGRRLSARDVAFALAVGLGSGWAVTFVFQELFLVRLP